MTRAIRKSPSSRDPRTWLWLHDGFAPGAVPPYKWKIQSSGITNYFQRLNGGLVLPLKSETGVSAAYEIWDFYPAGPTWRLFIAGYEPPMPGPTLVSTRFEVLIQFAGHTDPASGVIEQLYPVANSIRTVAMLKPDLSPHPDFPDVVTITPVPWWTPDSEVG